MKFYNLITTALFASVFTMMSCSQIDELDEQQVDNKKNELQINVIDAGVYGNTTLRAVEDGYKTTFVEGDEIGVYGIKNGNFEFENKKFTMQADGSWKILGSAIEYTEEQLGDVKFYAYYPYQSEGVDFDKTVSTKEDPFAKEVESWEIGTDLDENYTKYDLMASKATDITPSNNMGKLDFVLTHRMSIASIALASKVYKFENTDPVLDPYTIPAEAKEFKVKQGANTTEKVVKPYYDEKNNSYRILVKPGIDYTISGSYLLGINKSYTMTRTAAEGVKEGKVVKFNVGNAVEIKHTLKVGDYYCADGSIVSNEATDPANVIGVVYFVGNPQPSVLYADNSTYTEAKDALKRDFPNCKHGLVIALNNANSGKATRFSTGTGKSKNQGIGDWMGQQADLKAQYISSTKWANYGIPEILGYNNTKLMDVCYNEGTMKALCDNMLSILKSYNQEINTPSLCTGWICPSLGDFIEIMNNYNSIKTNIENANGTLPAYGELLTGTKTKTFYWTNTERNYDPMFITGLNESEYTTLDKDGLHTYQNISRNTSSNEGFFRFCLAF